VRQSLSQLRLSHPFAKLSIAHPESVAPLEGAHFIHANGKLQAALGLKQIDDTEQQHYVDYLGGALTWRQARPVASAYAGHQFGIYVPQLGDGRAVVVGQVHGTDGGHYELSLKGSGPTRFSRGADGRAVLRSTIREYLCSEAMHALGIPSTRALAIVGSDTPVQREILESAAVMVRVARTHIRFGHFEYLHYRNEHKALKHLAEFTLEHYHPDIPRNDGRYLELFRRAVTATAEMIAHWQAMGFAHGVMNTDNMSILGETLDYGPYGFMEQFDPQWVCNHSDTRGRYAWHHQPSIGLWNLAALGQALSSLIDEETLKQCLSDYERTLTECWLKRMRARLGLLDAREGDLKLITDWLEMLRTQKSDYHRSFRALHYLPDDEAGAKEMGYPCADDRFDAWNTSYRERLTQQGNAQKRLALMERSNPIYVLRNYLAEQAISRANEERDYTELDRLFKLVQSPFEQVQGSDAYTQSAPEWAADLQLSCSS
jgi:uncharacterized protein YdiU (UPF0061 family)